MVGRNASAKHVRAQRRERDINPACERKSCVCSRLGCRMNFVGEFSGVCRFPRWRLDVEVRPGI